MFKTPVFPNLPVLVVDDSPFARRTIRGMLETVGMRHVVEAGDGNDALVRLSQFKPAMIILDWNLPIVDAAGVLDVLRDPRASTETTIPVIVMTASPTRRLINEALKREVRHVLKKPFGPKMLWQRISTFFDEDPRNVGDVGLNALLPADDGAKARAAAKKGKAGRGAVNIGALARSPATSN